MIFIFLIKYLNFRFLGSDDVENFFSRAQRSRIVFEILSTTAFGREKKGEVNSFTFLYLYVEGFEPADQINVESSNRSAHGQQGRGGCLFQPPIPQISKKYTFFPS